MTRQSNPLRRRFTAGEDDRKQSDCRRKKWRLNASFFWAGAFASSPIMVRITFVRSPERWLSGLRQRFAKPSYRDYRYRGFESRPLRQPFFLYFIRQETSPSSFLSFIHLVYFLHPLLSTRTALILAYNSLLFMTNQVRLVKLSTRSN